MKKTWWRVPLYCMIASWICWQINIHLVSRIASVILPDGTISADYTIYMIFSGVLFFTTIAVGIIYFFREMTRKELFCSASVLVVLNIVFGLISYKYKMQGMLTFYWSVLSTWSSFVSELLIAIGLNIWIITIISWVLPPYLFMFFGKRNSEK